MLQRVVRILSSLLPLVSVSHLYIPSLQRASLCLQQPSFTLVSELPLNGLFTCFAPVSTSRIRAILSSNLHECSSNEQSWSWAYFSYALHAYCSGEHFLSMSLLLVLLLVCFTRASNSWLWAVSSFALHVYCSGKHLLNMSEPLWYLSASSRFALCISWSSVNSLEWGISSNFFH